MNKPEERVRIWRNWVAYVREFPKRYRVAHHWQGDCLIDTLEEYVLDCRHRQDPFSGCVIKSTSRQWDWTIVEQLPPRTCERGVYDPARTPTYYRG